MKVSELIGYLSKYPQEAELRLLILGNRSEAKLDFLLMSKDEKVNLKEGITLVGQ